MPGFITRIDLHEGSEEDYERLHSAMQQRGFSRTIKSSAREIYVLPKAEYYRSGHDLTIEAVCDDANKGASSVTKNFGLLIAQTTREIYFRGLRKMQESSVIQ